MGEYTADAKGTKEAGLSTMIRHSTNLDSAYELTPIQKSVYHVISDVNTSADTRYTFVGPFPGSGFVSRPISSKI